MAVAKARAEIQSKVQVSGFVFPVGQSRQPLQATHLRLVWCCSV